MLDEDLGSLLCSLHDCLMLAAPRGWTAVRARLVFAFPDFRIERLDVAAPEGPPHPAMGTLPAAELTRLGSGVTELRAALRARGRKWRGDELRVERGREGARWRCLDDGVEGPALDEVLSPDQLDLLLYTDALMAAFDETQPRWRERQARIAARFGGNVRWRVDQDAGTLSVGDVSLPVEIIGGWSREGESWGWGWANASVEPRLSARTRAICDPDVQRPGLSALWRDAYPCDPGFADVIAAHVAELLDAQALWRQDLADGFAYFAAI